MIKEIVCPDCGQMKYNGRKGRCRKCQAAYQNAYYQRRKLEISKARSIKNDALRYPKGWGIIR